MLSIMSKFTKKYETIIKIKLYNDHGMHILLYFNHVQKKIQIFFYWRPMEQEERKKKKQKTMARTERMESMVNDLGLGDVEDGVEDGGDYFLNSIS